MKKSYLPIAIASIILLSGCASKPYYVHTTSDARPVPGAIDVVKPEIVDEERSRGNLVIDNNNLQSIDVGEFINKYHAKQKPKFIIYVNKELGEDVSVVTKEGRIAFNSATDSNSWLFQSIKTGGEPEKETGYFKYFMDKIEKGYIAPFLTYQVHVLDRSYMLRNQEVKYDKGAERKSFSVLEMNALKEQADVFISVIPMFSNDKIEINIKAINLKDGQILVNQTQEFVNGSVRQIVLTNKGYEVQKSAGNLDEKLSAIAKQTMQNIGKSW